MSRPKLAVRRVALVELTRAPAPVGYDPVPKNRKQRRQLGRALKRAKKEKGQQGA